METSRLYFREQTKELLEGLSEQTVEQQKQFFGFTSTTELEAELIKVKLRLSGSNKKDWIKWDLLEKNSGAVIGSCLYHNWERDHEKAELGYSLHEPFRKQGYMHEAISKLLEFGFESMALNRIEAFISPTNAASKKLISSLGFTLEGTLRENYKFQNIIHDSMVYSLLKSEYKGNEYSIPPI
jgi:[ribosomal protein S5]-alanine N-acetyltransferase